MPPVNVPHRPTHRQHYYFHTGMRRASAGASPSLEALSCPPRGFTASSSTQHKPQPAASNSHDLQQQQQRAHVRRVLQARHAFEVLELPVQSTSGPLVRTAFRRLALLLHPDKNAAEDAQKAFIRLSEAYEVLRNTGEQRELVAKLQQQQRRKGHNQDDATAAWTSFSFVRPGGVSTSGSSASSSSNTTSDTAKSKSSSSSSRSFMDVLREWEEFERDYMEELRGKQTSVETQARKEKKRSRREDVEERQAAERRVLLAHLMESVRDDEDDDEGEEAAKGGKEEGEVEEEEPTPRRKGNTWQNFLRGKKRKQGREAGSGGGSGVKNRKK